MSGSSSSSEKAVTEGAPLRVLHESVVLAEEIDALGHMNVRFYASRALASTARILSELDAESESFGEISPKDYDLTGLFTRYHREQHTGSPLVVRGGLLEASADGVRLYHELRNPERDELAASFVHDVRFHAGELREPIEVPAALQAELAVQVVDFPKEGAPRSIDLDRKPKAPTLQEALDAGFAFRMPRTIEAETCDADGRLTPEMRPFYMWGGDPIPPAKSLDGPQLVDLPDGGKMGWASMENRSVLMKEARVGMRVQSFAAVVEIARKTNVHRYWIFDLDTGELVISNEVVELALHLGKRRAIEIPADIRARMERDLRADLR